MFPSIQLMRRQRGISMAFLLFAMIVVSLLAAALMQLNSQSNIANAQQVIATRAFFAAESGAQAQALNIFPLDPIALPPVCANQVFNFTSDGLKGCSATTTCTPTVIAANTFYEVTSRGQCNSGQALQSSRTILVRLKEVGTP